MYVTLDQNHPQLIREVRCAVCSTVIASLVPLDTEVDRKVETAGSVTTITVWKLCTLAHNHLAGGERTFTLNNETVVSVPVCKTCCNRSLTAQEVAETLERTAATAEAFYPNTLAPLSTALRDTALVARGRARHETNT